MVRFDPNRPLLDSTSESDVSNDGNNNLGEITKDCEPTDKFDHNA